MLLCTLDIDGTTRRVSNEELSLEHSWFAELSSAPTVKYATKAEYGGLCAPTFGGFQTIPTTFTETTWPPPVTITATVQHTETDEADAVTLFTATCHRAGFDQETVAYTTQKEEIDKERTATTISGTLVDVFTTYTGASWLNVTLDSTLARSPSPAVSYTISSDVQVLDMLSDIAAFFSHLFYIADGTLYLIDMEADNGTVELTEFDFLPVKYDDPPPYSLYKGNTSKVTGSHPYGKELNVSPVCHGTGANIVTALTAIKGIMERPRATVALPITTTTVAIKPGTRLEWVDESQGETITAWIRARSINYDFNNEIMTIEGEGGIS
jgi:hypothetical protein